MFTHNINPILFKWGFIEVRWYGLVYFFGFLLMVYVLMKKRKRLKLNKDEVYDLSFWLILGVLLGARLFHVLWMPSIYLRNPLELFMIWHGGMSYHGGLLGIIIAGIIYSRIKRFSFWRLADIIAVPAALILFLGRMANFINGELYGTKTTAWWCFNFKGVEGCRHPYQFYDGFGRLVSFFILWPLSKKKLPDGFVFWTAFVLLNMSRIMSDFFRANARWVGLTLGQYLSLLFILVGLGFMLTIYKKTFKKN